MTAQIIPFSGCDSKAPKLPNRSGAFDPDVFAYWLNLIRKQGKQHASLAIRILTVDGITLETEACEQYGYFPGHYFEALDRRSGIKRLYLGKPDCLNRYRLRAIAETNVRKVLNGRIKPEFQTEALEEIEHQMGILAPGWRVWGSKERAAFARLREWKQARVC